MVDRPACVAFVVVWGLLCVGCRKEFVSSDGSDSASESAGTDESSGEGTTGDPDPHAVCQACQDERCADYLAECQADNTCVVCLGAPYSLTCLSHEGFRKVANCSCTDCATECPHLCPGGQGACTSCGVTACSAQGSACASEPACGKCLDDPWAEGCDQDPTFMAALECQCSNCGQECVWQCPMAANDCAGCITSSCQTQFAQCLQDAACVDCFESPLTAGCEENAALVELQTCTCDGCNDLCGVLFSCP